MFETCLAPYQPGAHVASFDQRGQHVERQTNIASGSPESVAINEIRQAIAACQAELARLRAVQSSSGLDQAALELDRADAAAKRGHQDLPSVHAAIASAEAVLDNDRDRFGELVASLTDLRVATR